MQQKHRRCKRAVEVNEGVQFYNTVGKIFIVCGIGSLLLLGFVSLLPQDYEKYNIPLFFGIWALISLGLLAVGLIPLLLGKYSRKYRMWAEKELRSYNKRTEERMLMRGEKWMKRVLKRENGRY